MSLLHTSIVLVSILRCAALKWQNRYEAERNQVYGNSSLVSAWPSGDGTITPNFFSSTTPWSSTDGKRIQAHSGMVFHDPSKDLTWQWIGNSDASGKIGGSQNTQISIYEAAELSGPWGPEKVLLTIDQLKLLNQIDDKIAFMERPHIHQRGGKYYLFVHLDDKDYRQRKVGIFQMGELSAPSKSNPWTTVFMGRPGVNKNRGGSGFEVADFNIYWDSVSEQLLYATTTDSYVWEHPYYCDTDVTLEACIGDLEHCRFCYNSAVVLFTVDLDHMSAGKLEADSFKPVATLPGRWEGIAMFRTPSDKTHLYMMCSGQDGFGSNPVNLFAMELGSEGSNFKETSKQQSAYDWAAPSLFTCLGNPFSGSANAFNSQPTQVLLNPHNSDYAIYIGDNWLHGPGRDGSSETCTSLGKPKKDVECEPWTGTCPCDWPEGTCPGTSNPGSKAGYVWLSFSLSDVGKTDYLLCADEAWNMKTPDTAKSTCFTFNLFPDEAHTSGFAPKEDYGGPGSHVPFVRKGCGFVQCPGWPMTAEENADPDCCKKLGDSITSPKYVGRCRRDDLCGGKCKETENGNIPSGDGYCVWKAFDSSKASLLGGNLDCTKVRGELGLAVDSCRGTHSFPK